MKFFVLQYNGKKNIPEWIKQFKIKNFLNNKGRPVKNVSSAWIVNCTHKSLLDKKLDNYFWNWLKEKKFFNILEVKITLKK